MNLGYLDGHAGWINSQALIAKHADLTNNMGGWSPEMGVAAFMPVGNAVPDDCGFADQVLY